MQSESKEFDREKFKLTSSSGNYRIPGFSEAYAVYLKDCGKWTGFTGMLLLLLGSVIGAAALGSLFFGPSTITYNLSSGPSWFQYFQMYAVPITGAGGAFFTLGGTLYAKRALGREAFLVSLYEIIAPDGQVVKGTVHIGYLGGDEFNIEIP